MFWVRREIVRAGEMSGDVSEGGDILGECATLAIALVKLACHRLCTRMAASATSVSCQSALWRWWWWLGLMSLASLTSCDCAYDVSMAETCQRVSWGATGRHQSLAVDWICDCLLNWFDSRRRRYVTQILSVLSVTNSFFPTALTGFCFVSWLWKVFLK